MLKFFFTKSVRRKLKKVGNHCERAKEVIPELLLPFKFPTKHYTNLSIFKNASQICNLRLLINRSLHFK
jgi:hypothetical protein